LRSRPRYGRDFPPWVGHHASCRGATSTLTWGRPIDWGFAPAFRSNTTIPMFVSLRQPVAANPS
jgi:hypothetical protein